MELEEKKTPKGGENVETAKGEGEKETPKGGEVSSEPKGGIDKEKYPEWVRRFFDFLGGLGF